MRLGLRCRWMSQLRLRWLMVRGSRAMSFPHNDTNRRLDNAKLSMNVWRKRSYKKKNNE